MITRGHKLRMIKFLPLLPFKYLIESGSICAQEHSRRIYLTQSTQLGAPGVDCPCPISNLAQWSQMSAERVMTRVNALHPCHAQMCNQGEQGNTETQTITHSLLCCCCDD